MHTLQLQKREFSPLVPELVEERQQWADTVLDTNRPNARGNWIAAVIFMQIACAAAMSGALFSAIMAFLLIARGG